MARSFRTANELHRFLKGQSGNPAGRPRGSKNLMTLFKERRDTRVRVIENGRERWITAGELAVRGVYERALKGDMAALKAWLNLKKEADKATSKQEQFGYLLVPEPMSQEAWTQRHGITSTSALKRQAEPPGEAS